MSPERARLQLINATVLDPLDGSRTTGQTIVVEGDTIVEVGNPSVDQSEATGSGVDLIDVGGRIVMPGLIDAHVHLLGFEIDLGVPARESPLYVAGRAAELMRQMLERGFTTVRDVGGADHGLARAVEEGYFVGPRIFHGGPALSQTGGHGDFRAPGDGCAHLSPTVPVVGRVCDGVAAVRTAAREEIRRGARHLKLMLGGGIASPTDRIDSAQFSVEEIEAAVEEASNANIYVTGHAYTPETMARALRLGVRCIEHGTLLDEPTAELFVEHNAFLVPTLAIGQLLASPEGATYGVTNESRRKAEAAVAAGLNSLRIAQKHGVSLVFGTDFIGAMHSFQSREFAVRSQVLSPLEVLRSATTTAARLLGCEDELGRVAPGYRADLLVLSADPLDDAAVLAEPDRVIDTIVSRGRVVRRDVRERPCLPSGTTNRLPSHGTHEDI